MQDSFRIIGRIVARFLLIAGISIFIISLAVILIKTYMENNGTYTGIQEVLMNRFAILGVPCIGMMSVGYALLSKILGWRIIILFIGLLIGLIYTWVYGGVYIQQALR